MINTLNQFNDQIYQNILKPLFFSIDPEPVHDTFAKIGNGISQSDALLNLTEKVLAFKSDKLQKEVNGIKFANPIGLAAGFDYDGLNAKIMKYVGFGFNTVGTVTAKPYEGNAKPRLTRLIKSKSILVNKGFKSLGVIEVAKLLDDHSSRGKGFDNHPLGISVGSTNTLEIDTVNKAIDDYLFTFNHLKDKSYIKYFEVNISCPNTKVPESFGEPVNFENLIAEIRKLDIKKPLFIKMANEIDFDRLETLTKIALKQKINTFILGNLLKNRENESFVKEEIESVKDLKGNFSGRPTFKNSNDRIKFLRDKFKEDVNIIGCGGIFTIDDLMAKLDAGADLVQLITGMIFEGPQLIGKLNKELYKRIN